MAVSAGTVTLSSGTGAKSVNIGMIPTWFNIEFSGSGIKYSKGYIYNTAQWVRPDIDSSIIPSKVIQVKDTTGTIVLEGTFTSYSGGTQINFNITTQTGTVPQAFLSFGN